MKTIKGPAIFLAQFLDKTPPYDTLPNICKWVKSLGFKAIQLPTIDDTCINIQRAAESKDYAQEIKGIVAENGLEISDISTHIQGQLVAVHPAYDILFENFVPAPIRGDKKATMEWAIQQMKYAAKAAQNLGLNACATFSGSLLWPYFYPWPQRPDGLIEEGFKTLGKRWLPILNEYDNCGVDLCYETHASEDIFDGITYEMFLEQVNHHSRACLLYDPSHFILQCLDYLSFIDIYHEKIKMFHVKDAEFNPTGKQGVYSGYQSWVNRAGRFRSLGDGQVDFKAVFSKMAQYDFPGWAVLEWECALKHPAEGAKEGAIFINDHIIKVTDKVFDDFVQVKTDDNINKKILGL